TPRSQPHPHLTPTSTATPLSASAIKFPTDGSTAPKKCRRPTTRQIEKKVNQPNNNQKAGQRSKPPIRPPNPKSCPPSSSARPPPPETPSPPPSSSPPRAPHPIPA